MTPFGTTSDGRAVHAIDIGSDDLTARILTFGAVINDVRLTSLGHPLTLGSSDLAAYEGAFKSFGSLMGPVVNRIKDARAVIAGQEYRFEANQDGQNTLHSGKTGTHLQVWEVESHRADTVTLALDLADGLGGFPGNRRVSVTYQIVGAALTMEVRCSSDAATAISFANHSYWNLDGSANYGGHKLRVLADHYLPTDDQLMPTGAVTSVANTRFDLRDGVILTGDDSQFFDLNFCVAYAPRALRDVAVLTGTNGVTMTMASTAPGLQAYDAGTMRDQSFASHIGTAYRPYAGFALEAQHWPGALAQPSFPSIVYAAGETYAQTTRWRFTAP